MKLDELIMVDPRENSRKTTYVLNSKCRGVAADLPVSNQSGWSEVSMVPKSVSHLGKSCPATMGAGKCLKRNDRK
jgi:hypothetical protein